MSLPERCTRHAPVPWVAMSERELRRRRRHLARVILSAGLAARDAERQQDEDAYRDALARMETARARWRELTDEGGAS